MNYQITPRKVFVGIATALATLFAVPLIQGGVSKFAEKRGYDQLLGNQLESAVDSLAAFTQSGPFLFTLALFVGGTLALGVDWLYRRWGIWRAGRPLSELSKKNMDHRLNAMTLMFIFGALFVLSAGYYYVTTRNTATAVSAAPPPAAPQAPTVPMPEETRIRLQFGAPNTIPNAVELENIWRWYALQQVVVLVSPKEPNKEIRTWTLFLTIDKPFEAKQIFIESNNPLPRYEVKDRDVRSVVIAFMGEVPANTLVEVRLLAKTGEIKPRLEQRSEPGVAPIAASPPKAKPHYEPSEIGIMLGVLRQWNEIIDRKIAPGYQMASEALQRWNRLSGPSADAPYYNEAAERIDAGWKDILRLLNDNQYYADQLRPIVQEDGAYNTEMVVSLRQLASDIEVLSKAQVDITRFAENTYDKVQKMRTGLGQWIGQTQSKIMLKTKELREWQNP